MHPAAAVQRDHRLEGVALGEVIGGDDGGDAEVFERAQLRVPAIEWSRRCGHGRREPEGVHALRMMRDRRRVEQLARPCDARSAGGAPVRSP